LTLAGLIGEVARRLRAAPLHYGHGTDNPRDEAAYLVLRGLGLPFDASLQEEVLSHELRRVETLVSRRIDKRIPAAYLLREAWLDDRCFYVDRRVIVPRSHIPFVLKRLRLAPRRILDLCTGSGCLAILAAYAYPKALVEATDLSAEALQVARRNLRDHHLEKRVKLRRSDLFGALRGRSYDLIISNPPYVTRSAMKALPAEYRYEPGIALAGGSDGLELVERIIAQAADHLQPGGLLVCEVGSGRAALERAHPRLALRWPVDEVFVLRHKRPRLGAAR
jgi:ribosomal protein L3 glutamine methyltransferase